MQLFLDSADLNEIEQVLESGVIAGITTNPSILARVNADWREQIHKIGELLIPYNPPLHLSVEMTVADPSQMMDNAIYLAKEFKEIRGLTIKVPVGWQELSIINKLHYKNIRVNATACMSEIQCLMAAKACADYVSLFWGRIRDSGANPDRVVSDTRSLLDENKIRSWIIVGSIRTPEDVCDALKAGAHIVTVPYKHLIELCRHPKTDEVVAQFMRDAKTLLVV